MAKEYVEQRDGGYWIIGTRVSLESVVCAFLRGAALESIAQSFPILKLEEVYGAITYYLSHRPDVDAHLRQHDRELRPCAPRLGKQILPCTRNWKNPRRSKKSASV
jgi:uncharacterized protein (DUF433 family)